MHTRLFPGLLVLPVAALVLAGCSSAGRGAMPSEESDLVQVIASTSVYGDIAKSIGGDSVAVTSVITSTAQDPHSYEATTRDQLAISKATVVIENGGGYDPFIDTLLEASNNDGATVLNASGLSGLLPEETSDHEEEEGEEHSEDAEEHDRIEGFNEHVWYSFDAVDSLARALADEFSARDSANASTYEDNYADFASQLDELAASAEAIASAHPGAGAAITEPVPLYLLEAAGLQSKTPDAFSEAIEEGTDVSPAVLRDTLALFAGGEVVLLAYNEQTAGPETEQVRSAAEAAGVPVVSFTETLPEGAGYVSWMTDNLDALSSALG